MLVVTRRPSEAIVRELPTGELMEVTVVGVKGKQVRLATDAPKHLMVVRNELTFGPLAEANTNRYCTRKNDPIQKLNGSARTSEERHKIAVRSP